MVTFRQGVCSDSDRCGDVVKIDSGNPGPLVALERRYLTIVFSDLVGYTQLSEQMEPEDLRDLQIRYQHEALKTMESYGGFVASYSGDGILVYFGYPTAHENDAERAVRASLELLKRVPALEATTGAGLATPLAVRIGVHSGLLVIGAELLSMGRTEFGVVGEAVNLASRLKDEAPVDSVVVSNETLELIEGLFDTEPLGDWRIKGLSRNVAVHRVIGPRPAGGRARGKDASRCDAHDRTTAGSWSSCSKSGARRRRSSAARRCRLWARRGSARRG